MKELIAPVPVEQIMAELTPERFVRTTNYGGNQIYILDNNNSPMILRELGRLREEAFRAAGGGTGKELDLDAYDLSENPYQQLIVWDPSSREILGGYRFKLLGSSTRDADGKYQLATGKLFHFDEKFQEEYLPYTIELGRSFVQVHYQASAAGRKSLFSLDNLWDGLGAMCVLYPDMKYFFGKVTMYPHFDKDSRDLLLYFMKTVCNDPDQLIVPHQPLPFHGDVSQFAELFNGADYLDNYKILVREMRSRGNNVPPLINAYLNISSTLRSFGTTLNLTFGEVEETGILVTIADIYPEKRKRHVSTFNPNEQQPSLEA